jgi:hypothetical protein
VGCIRRLWRRGKGDRRRAGSTLDRSRQTGRGLRAVCSGSQHALLVREAPTIRDVVSGLGLDVLEMTHGKAD